MCASWRKFMDPKNITHTYTHLENYTLKKRCRKRYIYIVIYTAVDFVSQVRQCHGHCRNIHTHSHIFSIEFHLNQDDIEFCVKFVRLSMCEMVNNFSLFSVTFWMVCIVHPCWIDVCMSVKRCIHAMNSDYRNALVIVSWGESPSFCFAHILRTQLHTWYKNGKKKHHHRDSNSHHYST